MTALYYLIGVLIFVLAIVVSIGLHEFGHMIPAKRFGGKVTQYFIGFGKTVWSKQIGETEYGVKSIPLGGYVKIVGMLPPDDDRDPVLGLAPGAPMRIRRSSTGMFAQLATDARTAEWETIGPEDTDRLFYRMAWWKKVIVMAGGPTVNLLIAFFLFWGIFATIGNASDRSITPVVTEVSKCALPSNEAGRACKLTGPLDKRDAVAPAYAMGVKVGDRIVSFNGEPVTSWSKLQEQIRGAKKGTQVHLVVERGGKTVPLKPAEIVVIPRQVSDTSATLKPVGFLGITPDESAAKTGGPIYTLRQMGTMVGESAKAIVTLPSKVWDVSKALVGLQKRDPNGPVSIVGGGRIAGEVASAHGHPVQDKLVGLLMLIAGFNLFIGMFNFVPLLPLDGGHIAGAIWEAVRRGWARLRNNPDPGYVDVARLLPIAYVVASAFLLMSVVLILADIFDPIHLTS